MICLTRWGTLDGPVTEHPCTLVDFGFQSYNASDGSVLGDMQSGIWSAGPLVDYSKYEGFALRRIGGFAGVSLVGGAAVAFAPIVFGGGAEASFFEGASYTPKVIGQMGNAADLYHSFPILVDTLEGAGSVSKLIGGDLAAYMMLRIPGAVNGVPGYYRYIKDAAGLINERLFIPF
jgi:hypothetical protein